MSKGRAPCCDKTKVKRGPWSYDEDLKLFRSMVIRTGDLSLTKLVWHEWSSSRWINYLRPDVKRGNFSVEEEETIVKLHQSIGSKWSKIASKLPERTDNKMKKMCGIHISRKD